MEPHRVTHSLVKALRAVPDFADLDDATLRVVWEHHVAPLLAEYFAGQPGRTAAYALPDLLSGRKRRGGRDAAPSRPGV